MAKNTLALKNNRKAKRQWELVYNFEQKRKKTTLKRLTINKSLQIYRELYQFGQEINGSTYYGKLDPMKVGVLSNIHFMFMKVES